MTETILILDPMALGKADQMRALMPPGFVLTHATARGDDHLCAIIADADYAISGQVPVSGRVLRAAGKLKLLHKWGVGVDNFDLDAARECRIKVARTTGSNAVPVAEFAIGLMLATLRNMAGGHHGMQERVWQRNMREAFLLSNKTVGLVGFGAIGKNVARLLQGFSCTILYNKTKPLDAAEEARLGVKFATVPELLRQSDIVSLHCPLTPTTTGLIDRAALSSMKKTAILVNCARGGVVLEDDLVWALKNGVIHAAAADVYEIEPLPPTSPLIGVPNMMITPHLAAMNADTFEPTVSRMFRNIQHVSRGEPVPALDLVVG